MYDLKRKRESKQNRKKKNYFARARVTHMSLARVSRDDVEHIHSVDEVIKSVMSYGLDCFSITLWEHILGKVTASRSLSH